MKVELQLLGYHVVLAQRDWHISVPKHEKVFAFASVEGLAHVLDCLLFILDECVLVGGLRVAHLFLKHFDRSYVAVFKHVLLDGLIDIFLGSCKLVEVHLAGAAWG